MKSVVVEKDRNRIMLRAKELTTNRKFLRLSFAWWMPSAVSILQKNVFAALRTGARRLVFPHTAANGEALEALFAGARDARSTVRMPMMIPAAILGMLTAKAGISEKYLGLRKRSTAHNIQMTTALKRMLAGMA